MGCPIAASLHYLLLLFDMLYASIISQHHWPASLASIIIGDHHRCHHYH